MKKLIISAVFVASFVGYVFYVNRGKGDDEVVMAAISNSATSSISNTGTTSDIAAGSAPPSNIPVKTPPTTTPTPIVTPPPAPKGQYKDGTYTGIAADAYYGNIQVAAVISGGKLTNVTFLQYPGDRRESVYINQQAMPALKSEAISAQSANVGGVSGASDTSAAFKESLASALSQARV